MSDDTGILIFLAIGVLVVIAIVFFGVLSSRKKKRATKSTWTTRTEWIGEQPFIASSDLAADDTRQVELFRETYAIGTRVTITSVGDDGEPTAREVHVSRIGTSLRAGWPQAKRGVTAYFREWENSEFPVSFSVKGSDKIVEITMDAESIAARDAAGAVVWASPWSSLRFSNGPDIMLANGAVAPIRFAYENGSDLEEIIIKYGTLKQMHF